MSESTASANSRSSSAPMRSSNPAANHCSSRARRARRPSQHDDLVDDQLADIEGGDRQQRPGQAENAFADGQERTRLPDEPDKRRQIAQRADAFAQRARSGRCCLPRRGGLGRASPHRVMLGHRAVKTSGGCRRGRRKRSHGTTTIASVGGSLTWNHPLADYFVPRAAGKCRHASHENSTQAR